MSVLTRLSLGLLISAALALQSTATCSARTLRTVAFTGEAADSDGGESLSFSQFGTATINRDGEVVLLARSQKGDSTTADGVWSEGGGQGLRLVALDGRAAPGVAGGIYATMSGNYPIINDTGQVLFRARLATAPGITGTNNSGVWVANPGQTPTLVLREGDSAPGAAAGAVFSDQSDVFGERYSAFNDLGQVAWLTELLIGTGGVTGNNDFGVWRAGGGGSTLMVGLEGAVAAGVSPTRFYGNILGTPQMNDLGQVTFSAPLKTTAGGTTTSGSGIWLGDPASGVTLLARDGQSAPGVSGGTFATLTRPTLNDRSEYVFSGSLAVAGSVTTLNDSAVWVARGSNPMALFAREADHAPGTGPAVGFSTFQTLRINSAGRVALVGTLATIPGMSDSGITTLNDTGIWAEGDSGLQLVARENDQAPDVAAGVLFDLLRDPAMNAAGQVAFMADLRGTGITTANKTGLWAQNSGGSLSLIARAGDTIDVDDGPGVDLRTVSQLGFFADSGGEDGQRTGLNQLGQICFTALFTDSTSGVFVVDTNDALPGDFNHNGVVDAGDYVVWRKNPGGVYTQSDFNTWRAHFGQPGGGGSGVTVRAIPEPATLVLLALAASGLVWSRKRLARFAGESAGRT